VYIWLLLLLLTGHRNLHLTQPNSVMECKQAWQLHMSLAPAAAAAAAAI
jgi:hypothetical protein